MTRPGLPLAVGEPAINPAPRAMIREALAEFAEANGAASSGGMGPDVTVTIAIPGGERLALKTMNARLGIVGGLSVLGTTGIVVPYSCASWIHAIHRGIDVARAAGLDHIAAATGTTSERAVQRALRSARARPDRHGRFRRRHAQISAPPSGRAADPGRRLRQAGQARRRPSRPAFEPQPGRWRRRSPRLLAELGARPGIRRRGGDAATVPSEILEIAGDRRRALAEAVARRAREVALATLSGDTAVEVAIVDRAGDFLARVGTWPAQGRAMPGESCQQRVPAPCQVALPEARNRAAPA